MAKLPSFDLVPDTGPGLGDTLPPAQNPPKLKLLESEPTFQPLQHRELAIGSGSHLAAHPADGESLAGHLKARGPLTDRELVMVINPICAALERLRTAGLRVSVLLPAQVFLPGGLGAFSPKLMGAGLLDFPTKRAAVDDRADVFALGALMYEASTGKPLPEGNALEGDAPPNSLQTVIRRCVSANPYERFLGPAEVACALETWLQRDGTTPIPLVDEVETEREGTLIGNYQLIRLLGEGSMGRVFLAHHVRLGRSVALKILRSEHVKNRDLIQRFFQEARAVNQINHEHIVEVFDFVEELSPGGRARVYCVMELLQGQTLSAAITKKPQTIGSAIRVMRQVCAALQSAHQLGVIHRDIKPDNLFLVEGRPTGEYAKVLDFGVAKLTTPLPNTPACSTMTGMVIGTPMYMAPEQAAGLSTDHRADVYSLATVLFEMLTGRPPFHGGTAMELMIKVLTDPVPPLPSRAASGERISKGLSALIRRCLSKDPAARPQSMRELSASLAPFENPAGTSQWKPVAISAAALAGVGLGVALLTHSSPKVNVPPPAVHRVVAAPPPPVPDSLPRDPPLAEKSPPASPTGPVHPSKKTRAVHRGNSERMSRDGVVDPFKM